LAAVAAARCGAGLVSVATRPEHIGAVVSHCPSVMVHGVVSGQELEPLLDRATVLVIGPGLGTGPWGEQLLQKAAATGKPMVVDADALNILSQGRLLKDAHRDNWILTPHPGEAARLLQCDTERVQRGRFGAVTALQQRLGGAVILKGAGSLVADGGGPVAICPYGNPGMATGGMGDVLSGVLGALLAQGLSVNAAARLGVCLHGAAADIAAADGERGLLPVDVIAELRALVNGGDALDD
jgi:NAD(P)H-hydrate epimerase